MILKSPFAASPSSSTMPRGSRRASAAQQLRLTLLAMHFAEIRFPNRRRRKAEKPASGTALAAASSPPNSGPLRYIHTLKGACAHFNVLSRHIKHAPSPRCPNDVYVGAKTSSPRGESPAKILNNFYKLDAS